jgi:hypothetical protein
MNERGFTLLEAMISTVVVTVGLVGMLAVFAVAVGSTQTVQLDEIARQKSTEALESIFTARATSQITWAQIQNISGTTPGIFSPGLIALTDPGPDGLDGTADDVPAGNIVVPGPSGVLDGVHDVTLVLSNFQRQIQINNVNNLDGSLNPNLRQIIVTVQYPTPNGRQRTYTVQALISSYR